MICCVLLTVEPGNGFISRETSGTGRGLFLLHTSILPLEAGRLGWGWSQLVSMFKPQRQIMIQKAYLFLILIKDKGEMKLVVA